MSYTVRFNRGNSGWTCAVFRMGATGLAEGASLASGTGRTKDDAKDAALAGTDIVEVRAALASADHSRPYWTQGTMGAEQEARRVEAAANDTTPRKRAARR
ncbi:MAG: hypothetical protein ABI652_01410 [Acidobacteriota bacterium]